jgi:hypothetical protein
MPSSPILSTNASSASKAGSFHATLRERPIKIGPRVIGGMAHSHAVPRNCPGGRIVPRCGAWPCPRSHGAACPDELCERTADERKSAGILLDPVTRSSTRGF